MAEGLSSDAVMQTIVDIAKDTGKIPDIVKHLAAMNGAVKDCVEKGIIRDVRINTLETKVASRSARWRMVLGSALKVTEAAVVAKALQVLITH